MDAPFHTVVIQVDYTSLDQVPREPLEEHVARSRRWHAEGRLLMAGAFLDRPGQPMVTAIRPWADILGLA